MLKTEFNTICESIDKGYKEISESHYKEIEFVYNYYPLSLSKRDVCDLYIRFGMGIIRDMTQRADDFHKLQVKRDEIKTRLDNVEQAISEMMADTVEN